MKKDLIEKLRVDYPSFRFCRGKRFAFRPPNKIIVGPSESNDSLLLLHEMGHAILAHKDFDTDASRLKMEREAWEKARELSEVYDIEFDDEVVERELDTYRDWLDKKSRCPKCRLTRFQTPDGQYHCPRCDSFRQLF